MKPEEHAHPLHTWEPRPSLSGVNRKLRALSELLTEAVQGEEQHGTAGNTRKLRPGVHHLALTGPAGIGKSELAFEVVRRNREKFPGGVIGIFPGWRQVAWQRAH